MGADAVGGIIGGVADIGSTVLDVVNSIFSMRAAQSAQEEERAMWKQERGDTLAQQRLDNMFRQDQLDLSKAGLDLTKRKFQVDDKFRKQQRLDLLKQFGQQMKDKKVQDTIGNLMNMTNSNQSANVNTLTQLGA